MTRLVREEHPRTHIPASHTLTQPVRLCNRCWRRWRKRPPKAPTSVC